jgi:hypothetical protein
MEFHFLIVSWQDAILLGQASDAIVWFAHSSDFSADSVGLNGIQHSAGGLIDINQVELNWSVVLGVNDSVASRAESRFWDYSFCLRLGFCFYQELLINRRWMLLIKVIFIHIVKCNKKSIKYLSIIAWNN